MSFEKSHGVVRVFIESKESKCAAYRAAGKLRRPRAAVNPDANPCQLHPLC